MELSKIEAGKIEIEKCNFSSRKLLDNLKSLFILKSQERNLSWEVCIDPNVPEIIIGDEHRIMQVLVNLTGNAFKFTESGGVWVKVSYLNECLEILVKDTGIGIPQNKLEDVFSAFEQVDNSHARKYGGTGLGLSITRNLLELMGGTIRVESSERGSEFFVSLPAPLGEINLQDHLELVFSEPQLSRSEPVIFLVVNRNEQKDIEVIMNIVKTSSFEGVNIKVLPYDVTTKDRILVAGTDLVLLYENIQGSRRGSLAEDLGKDFRTSFIPVISLKECCVDHITFQADSNALKYGENAQELEFYRFICRMIQDRDTYGTAMMERWLKKAETEIGTSQILLECLDDIVTRVANLENALVNQETENIQPLVHSLKDATGNLRMTEIYLKISEMDVELRKKPSDMEKVRIVFSSVKEILALIPKKYLKSQQLHSERQKNAESKLLVLVVDDNIENRKLIGNVLNRENLRYKEAENGKLAIEMLRAEHFSLVLLDSQMPVMDGLTALKQIRKDPVLKDLYVIMQTASTFKEEIQIFFEAGCDDFISKPVDLGLLQKKIAVFIAHREKALVAD